MRAYRMQDIDGQLRLSLQDVARPDPGPGQLLLRVRAAGLNRGEFIAGHGLHGSGGGPKPVGGEAAGEVVAVGPDVPGWQVGDRAMGRCQGAFADYVLLDVREALPVPEVLSWQHAAAIPLTFMVVYDMLVLQGRLQPGETLLVAGVSSGVGVAALLAAKSMGARVIGTSGSEAKLARLRQQGLDLGLHTRGADFVDAVMEATGGRGADVAINTVGGTVFAACVRALAFQGRLAMVGYVDGVLHADLDLEALHAKRLHLFGVSNKLRSPQQRGESVAGFRRDWLPLFANGHLSPPGRPKGEDRSAKHEGAPLRPLVDRVFPFEQLAEAKACMEGGEHLGKIVLDGSAQAGA